MSTPTIPSFDDHNSRLQALALKACKHAASLPLDLAFHRTMGKDLSREIDTCSSRVLSLTNQLLDLASTTESSTSRAKKRARLEAEDDVVDDFKSLIVDVMDRLLENTDMRLDDHLGLSKPPAIAVKPPPAPFKKSGGTSQGRLDPSLQHAARLPKPQLKFQRRSDNSDVSPWQPCLSHKYNAQVPLGFNVHTDGEADSSDKTTIHPYRYEINNIQYPSRMFTSVEPCLPNSFENTPFTWVDTPTAFAAMLEKLRVAQEIAIDLEHHSYRTFAGFVCLMQISTRESDWVVDTLALREELEELNEVFTDPNIVKVFHGADSDIIWLQQDFSLYIVNLFDTYHASKVLDFPRHNLATLLEMYCDFIPDKRYQLADWRIRPLPEEMLHYARSDTHFLLYIYDNLRNALLDRSQSQSRSQSRSQSPIGKNDITGTPGGDSADPDALLREVLSRSADTALRVYEREIYDAEGGAGPGGWDTLAKKWNKTAFTAAHGRGTKLSVYKAVHGWRDSVARSEDESTRYVLANHFVFSLAEQPPGDMSALLAMFSSVPPILRRKAGELLATIRNALKSHSLEGPKVIEPPQPISIVEPSKADITQVQEQPRVTTNDLFPSTSSPGQPLFLAPSSSLLNSGGLPVSQRSESYSTSTSVLFGDVANSRTLLLKSNTHKMRFNEVINRIHNGLIVAPSMPQVPKPSVAATTIAEDVERMTGVGEGSSTQSLEQAEIPYVPASQRQKPVTITEDDSIVVVGQTRQKKRKRAPKTTLPTDIASPTEASETESFDFASVPNVLDDGSDHEVTEDSRKKKSRGQANFYGNFRAPPKAHSQLKSGNQSRTFNR